MKNTIGAAQDSSFFKQNMDIPDARQQLSQANGVSWKLPIFVAGTLFGLVAIVAGRFFSNEPLMASGAVLVFTNSLAAYEIKKNLPISIHHVTRNTIDGDRHTSPDQAQSEEEERMAKWGINSNTREFLKTATKVDESLWAKENNLLAASKSWNTLSKRSAWSKWFSRKSDMS